MTIQAILRRVSVLVLIALFGVFALTVSTDATWDSVYGYDNDLPAWGNAAVWGFYHYSREGYVETSHSVGYYNLSADDNSSCTWNFESEIKEQPWFRAQSGGSARVRKGDSLTKGGTNIIWLAGLPRGWYTLSAYTQLQGGNISIKALAEKEFFHRD